MVSDSSFINSELFLQWLTHFKDHTKPTKEKPVLLLLDNHTSHTSIGAVDFYRNNNIIALTLPPHSSHKLQPLDRGFHSVLKKYFSNECEKWLRNHPGRAITVFQMAKIFTPAFYKAATPACAAECFKTTGIWPYNPDVFSEADFLACSVTERENEANVSTTEEESQRKLSSKESQNLSSNKIDDSICETTTRKSASKEVLASPPPNTNANDAEAVLLQGPNPRELETTPPPATNAGNQHECVVKDQHSIEVFPGEIEPLRLTNKIKNSTRLEDETRSIEVDAVQASIEPIPGCSTQSSVVKISDLSPFPKSTVKRSFTKNHKKSEVISSSPYKAELEKKNEKKSKPKVKKPKLEEIQKSSKTKKGKSLAKTVRMRNKELKTKKVWKCPGCGELYSEPIVEDWIECFQCKEWWHEKCTAYCTGGSFTCDFCLD
ncbi:hypothetical protein O0L34_g9227 [Tuta absoluta]|nr:hypothetical protein O0L34_g9227 [Tuta absoluta]